MTIEVQINAPELSGAIIKLAAALEATATVTKTGELQIPAGAPLTVTAVEPTTEPEKPKRKRVSKQAAEMLAESAQEAAGEPEAPQAATTPAEPEKPAATAEATEQPQVTISQIAAAGTEFLNQDSSHMAPLLALLDEFNVQAITMLKPEQLPSFAARLRQLGAEV